MTTWTNSRDQLKRTEVRITFRLSADDLAKLFAAEVSDGDLPRSRAAIRQAVRDQLNNYGLYNLMDAEPSDDHHHAVDLAFGVPS